MKGFGLLFRIGIAGILGGTMIIYAGPEIAPRWQGVLLLVVGIVVIGVSGFKLLVSKKAKPPNKDRIVEP